MYVAAVCGKHPRLCTRLTQKPTGTLAYYQFYNPTVGLDICIEAIAVIVIAGTLAGLIPARRAARIRPIEALRAE